MKPSAPTRGSCARAVVAAALAAIAATPGAVRAADCQWLGGTANWSSGNWNPNEPTSSDDAHLQGGTAQVTAGNNEYADDLYLSGGSLVQISGGSLYTGNSGSRQFVGYGSNQTGAISQSGGSNQIGYHLYLGYDTGSAGTYTMSGGSLYVDNTLYCGYDGTGVFQQSGGGVTANIVRLGDNAGAHGTYRLAGTGTLQVNSSATGIQVGTGSGTGRFEWFRSGGITANRMDFGSAGTLAMGYDFNAVPAIVSGLQYATLEVTNGATVTKTSDGVTSTVYNLRIGSSTGAGYGNQVGGTVQVNQMAYVGDGGTGVATQAGGAFNLAFHLYLGSNGGQGTYRLKGGTLNVGSNIFTGTGTGTMVLDGGTLSLSGNLFTVTNLVLGDEQAGSWTLAAGKTLTVTNHVVGRNTTGTFTQTGGTNNAGTLTIGQTAGSGTYLLSDGVLNVSGQVVDGTGTGTLQIEGGTFAPSGNVAVDHLKLGITASPTHTQTANTRTIGTLTIGGGTYRLAGGALAAGSVANTTGTGTLHIDGGTFAPAGAVAVDNLGLGIAAAGSHTQSAQTYTVGTLTLGSGTYTLAGGTLAAGSVANTTGTGTLVLNGGTFSPGGAVSVDNLHVGVNATAGHTQSSRTYQAAGGVVVGSGTGTGTYRLEEAGVLDIGDKLAIGHGGGTGRFEWFRSGGLTAAGGIEMGSSGTLAMGHDFDLQQLLDGSLFGGSLAGIGAATLEITGGATASQADGTAKLGRLVLGAAGGAGTLRLDGGALAVNELNLGGGGAGRLELADPAATVSVATTLHFGPGAELVAAPGSRITLTGGNLWNFSRDPVAMAGMADLTLAFQPAGVVALDHLELAGRDLGITMDGFEDNFALHTLIVGSPESPNHLDLLLVDMFPNQGPDPEALYVHNIFVHDGATLDMNSLNVYYDGVLEGGGLIINGTPQFIPEPATGATTALLAALALCRRRRAAARAQPRRGEPGAGAETVVC